LAKKNNLVVCLDGDGAAIMHLGALTTIGMIGPSNLLHVVLNNGAHESVGGQPTAGFSTNLTAIAENAGYKTVGKAVESEPILQDTIKTLLTSRGPAFIDVRLRKGSGKGPPPLQVFHQDLKDAFMKAIG